MTPGTLKAHIVVLSFEPPGPVHVNTWLAPDAASAAALATVHFMRTSGTEANLMACLTVEMPAEQLRHLLRAVEGKLPDSGNAEVLSLVSNKELSESPIGKQLRDRALNAADASTFTGRNVDRLWAENRPERLYWGGAARLKWGDEWVYDYGEPFGPPAPDPAA